MTRAEFIHRYVLLAMERTGRVEGPLAAAQKAADEVDRVAPFDRYSVSVQLGEISDVLKDVDRTLELIDNHIEGT